MSKSSRGFFDIWADAVWTGCRISRGLTLSTLSRENDTESRNSWVQLGKVGTESDGFGGQDSEANYEFRHSAFSRAVSAERPFEVRGRMEEEHTPETDNYMPPGFGGGRHV